MGQLPSCPAGFYSQVGGCLACPTDRVCPGGSPAPLIACPAGQIVVANACVNERLPSCSVGFYSQVGGCLACPTDRICPGGDPAPLIACPAGQTVLANACVNAYTPGCTYTCNDPNFYILTEVTSNQATCYNFPSQIACLYDLPSLQLQQSSADQPWCPQTLSANCPCHFNTVPTNGQCAYCPSTQYGMFGTCRACPPGSASDGLGGSCECPSGYTMGETACQANAGQSCVDWVCPAGFKDVGPAGGSNNNQTYCGGTRPGSASDYYATCTYDASHHLVRADGDCPPWLDLGCGCVANAVEISSGQCVYCPKSQSYQNGTCVNCPMGSSSNGVGGQCSYSVGGGAPLPTLSLPPGPAPTTGARRKHKRSSPEIDTLVSNAYKNSSKDLQSRHNNALVRQKRANWG